MPELPEVETLRRQLARKVCDKPIQGVAVYDSRIIRGTGTHAFAAALKGSKIYAVARRGKLLIFELSTKQYLLLHLRISGWLIASSTKEQFSRMAFHFPGKMRLNFCDKRMLSQVILTDDYRSFPLIRKMGPDALSFDKILFRSLCRRKKVGIKTLLMDSSCIAGIGNIYAQEALFCAGLHPAQNTRDIPDTLLDKLYSCLRVIIKDALRKGGSSVDTYRQLDGTAGGYTPLLKVYKRHKQPCIRCGSRVQRVTIAGRGTYICPRCQQKHA